MEYRTLGKSDLKISPICLGTMMFGRATESGEAGRIVAAARDAGVNFIDTADVFGKHHRPIDFRRSHALDIGDQGGE